MKVDTKKVKSLRLKHGFTQEYVAIEVGYSDKSAYCLLENGVRQPSVEKLGKLSKLFQVPVDDLLTEDE